MNTINDDSLWDMDIGVFGDRDRYSYNRRTSDWEMGWGYGGIDGIPVPTVFDRNRMPLSTVHISDFRSRIMHSCIHCNTQEDWMLYEDMDENVEEYLCSDCLRYTVSQEELTENIKQLAFQKGTELGIERGIRDTIYGYAKDEYYILPEIDIPDHVRFQKRLYTRTFEDAQQDAYEEVFQLHQPLIIELEQKFFREKIFHFLISKYQHSSIFEPRVFKYIDTFT